MYVPAGVPGILVQPAWCSFPWNRAPCKRTQDWLLYALRLSGGRVTTPEGCPENPQRERLEQVGRHPRRTCRLALRTKDPGGPGSNCGSAARDGRSRSRPCRREGSGWVQDPCRLGPWAPAPGWHVTQRCGRREDLKLSPPLSNHDPRSPARSLGCLISRIFHHLEHSWPPRRAQGLTSRRVYCFSANRRALRPAWAEAASHSSLAGERAQQGMKKPWPLSGRRLTGRLDALAL